MASSELPPPPHQSPGLGAEPPLAFRFSAMATEFELLLPGNFGSDAVLCTEALRAEVDRLEILLSRHLPESDISAINRSPVRSRTLVSADTRACLLAAYELWARTNGAFDPTVGALLPQRVRWQDGCASYPATAWGFENIHLHPASREVERLQPGVQLDLGAIAKGYAIDAALHVIEDWAPEWALISAGKSCVRMHRSPPSSHGWLFRFRDPRDEHTVLHELWLHDRALSTSARLDGHILDPDDARPAHAYEGTWAACSTATEADALSTAAMLMDDDLFFSGAWGSPGAELWRFSAARGLEHARA